MTAFRILVGKIWQGQPLTGDDVIALCLVMAMVMSLGHLFTMLATRWGDRYIAVKSLLGSLLVHAVCLLGLEVFDPLTPPAERTPPSAATTTEVVTKILIESEDSIVLSESGNTPFPNRPTTPDVELNRLPLDARLMDLPEQPDRTQEVLDSLQADAADVSKFETSDVPETAIPVDSGREGDTVTAANDFSASEQTMLEQSRADVYTPSIERLQTAPGDLHPSREPEERLMSSGSVPQIDTEIVAEDASMQIVTSDDPDGIAIPQADDSDTVRRRRSPLSGQDPLDLAGLGESRPPERTVPSQSFERRLPVPSRSFRPPEPQQRPVRQASTEAQTPIPLTADYDEVRTGVTDLNISDALRSAASLLDVSEHSIRRRATGPATYQLRDREKRREAAARFGGTAESEAAVERSLRWLSRMQSDDGHWDAETHGAGQVQIDELGVNRNHAGRDADTGITALVTLAFLGAGYTHENGQYALHVDHALDWLIRQQGSDGNLSGAAGHYARMYCHGIATYALAEALGMQNQIIPGPIIEPEVLSVPALAGQSCASVFLTAGGVSPVLSLATSDLASSAFAEQVGYGLRRVDELRLRSALAKAVTYTISQQDPDSGGWRYKFGQEGDVSMFGWQMMSLKSAEIAGIGIHPSVREKMVGFLNSVRQGEHGGLFGYRRSIIQNGRPTEPVSHVMTAEALFCQQMLGYPRDSPASREAVAYILQHMPRLAEVNTYYWYYGTLAMYQYGGRPWEEWNRIVRDTLITQQNLRGELAGSWDPNGPWGRYGGRLYSTAISTMTLEVYYRLLPLYRMNETVSESDR